MNRVIIENRSSAPDHEIVKFVSLIMAEGRVSNYGKQYAYGTRIGGADLPTVMIWTDLNKASDRFVAVNSE